MFTSNTLAQADSTKAFIDKHWQRPVVAAPLSSEHDLYPQACGQCHQTQYNDWRKSHHAKAMGPGIMGQLQGYSKEALKSQKCLTCHAPLVKQSQALIESTSTLHQQGIICAACHVRNEQWFGPGNASVKGKANHPKSQSVNAFKDSAFCASCHQFTNEGTKLEGKWLQNTYTEWLNSSFGKQNVTCQNCHMPNQRHLWRGIHSKSMVLSGLTLVAESLPSQNGFVRGHIKVTNSGVGHYFPTYVTPRVVIQGYMLDASGKMIEDTLLEYEIMRAVSEDLTVEYFDTRLAPNESYDFDYQIKKAVHAKTLVLRIVVEPDYFYHQIYPLLIEQAPGKKGVEALTQAHQNTADSTYVLFEKAYTQVTSK
jgi:hypothetical protein